MSSMNPKSNTAIGLCALLVTIGMCGSIACDQQKQSGPASKNSPLDQKHAFKRPEAQSLLGKTLLADETVPDFSRLQANLKTAHQDLIDNPNDPEKIIWLGRRYGYLWKMNDAIGAFTDGVRRFPEDPRFLRHRGHRFISIRKFDLAKSDLQTAAEMIAGRPDKTEPDGQPNDRNIPLTTTGFNIWYHLALADYLQGDFESALTSWEKAMKLGGRYDDNVVAVTHWMYMSLRRLGRHDEAQALLDRISPGMDIIENHAYVKLLAMYRGDVSAESLLAPSSGKDAALDDATIGYGVGNWHLYHGRKEQARRVFDRVIAGPYWPSFGYIAAEADLARLGR